MLWYRRVITIDAVVTCWNCLSVVVSKMPEYNRLRLEVAHGLDDTGHIG